MTISRTVLLAVALVSATFTFSTVGGANAAPTTIASGALLSASSPVTEIRYRRRVRRGGIGPAAVLGLFGAVLGGAIANGGYDNYSNYSYGAPNDYGYAPGYVPAPVHGGGGGRVFSGRGGGGHFGGGARGGGGGGAHAIRGGGGGRHK